MKRGRGEFTHLGCVCAEEGSFGGEGEEELDLMHWFPPAHDLVRQQDSAHLWVLVLAFVHDRLQDREKNKTSAIEMYGPIW